jgi:tripartite-type tricarboxylate transporter receptor subunit TctC
MPHCSLPTTSAAPRPPANVRRASGASSPARSLRPRRGATWPPPARWLCALLLAVSLPLLGHAPAQAQDFPTRPIRMVVPYGPGGSTDVLARLYAPRLTERLGQPVVVENRGGGGTLIGIRAVAQAAPDGHTLLFTTSVLAINPLIDPHSGYRLEDFAPIAPVGDFPYVLLVPAALPAATLTDLVARAKADPRWLNYSSLGRGSPTQLLASRFLAAAGIHAEEVNYAGSAAGMNDVIAGNVQMIFVGATAANLTAGPTRPLAVAAARRLPAAPDVPTFAELGYPTMIGGTWFGVFAPAGTHAAALGRLASATEAATESLRPRLAEMSLDPVPGGAANFATFIREDQARWAEDIRRLGPARR